MKKNIFLCAIAVIAAVLLGCDFLTDYKGATIAYKNLNAQVLPAVEKKWAVLVYMAADNDLESAAILDFNELEAVGLAKSPVAVYVLLDRSAAYDSTNDNWFGTRLYEIQDDPDGMNNRIVSRQLDCPPLGLSQGHETRLDMAQPFVLDTVLSHVKGLATTEQTALIMWGHGTGWRGGASSQSRAIAFDDSSGNYMFLRQMGEVLTHNTVDFLGLDVCFGATVEVVYEMRNTAKWLAGSPGMSPVNGWDYRDLLSLFLKTDLTPKSLAQCALEQYKKQYALSANTSFAVFDLSQLKDFTDAFDSFSLEASSLITDADTRNKVMDIFKNRCKRYTSQSYPTDCYLDIKDLLAKLASEFPQLAAAGEAVKEKLDKTLTQSWSASTESSIGVFFTVLSAPGIFVSTHSDSYKKGGNVLYQNAFVRDYDSWVPHEIPQNSVLDKLFYFAF